MDGVEKSLPNPHDPTLAIDRLAAVDALTIADRINEILDLIRGKESVTFERLFIAPLTREYVIVTFMAILEVCKLKMVKLLQANSFGVIWIVPSLLDNDLSEEELLDRHVT